MFSLNKFLVNTPKPILRLKHYLVGRYYLIRLVVKHINVILLSLGVVRLDKAKALIFTIVAHHRPSDDSELAVARCQNRYVCTQFPLPVDGLLHVQRLLKELHKLLVGIVALIVGGRVHNLLKQRLHIALIGTHHIAVLRTSGRHSTNGCSQKREPDFIKNICYHFIFYSYFCNYSKKRFLL